MTPIPKHANGLFSSPPGANPLLRSAEKIFPLRLTPFEEYMFLEGRLGNAMTFIFQMKFAGVVDRAAITEAVEIATDRHPLCRATVVRQTRARLAWSLEPKTRPAIRWVSEDGAPSDWNVALDLTQGPGVRVLVNQHGSGSTITVQFHHACCDGLGALQWIDDLLAAYDWLMSASKSALDLCVIHPERLVDRQRRRRSCDHGVPWLSKAIRELYKFYGQLPLPLEPIRGQNESPSCAANCLELTTHTFTKEESQRLRKVAHDAGVSLNDILVRDLFAALAQWNVDRQLPGDPWYRVSMPTSLRERNDNFTPAANIMSMAFLNCRHSAAIGEKSLTLARVHQEMNEIKRTCRATLFLDVLAILTTAPGALKFALQLPICMSTAVLTNVGNPCRRLKNRHPRLDDKIIVGNLQLTACDGVPPLRPRTHAAIGVTAYAGRLSLSLQMTPQSFDRAATERFLRMYSNALRESL